MRARLGCAAVIAAGATVLAMALPASAGPPTDTARAVATYNALQKYFYVGDGSALYHEQYPVQSTDNAYSYEWPFSQVHVATLDLRGVPAIGQQYAGALADREIGQQRYWKADGGTTGVPGYDSYAIAPYGGGGDMFYDDNEWVGLEKVQEYLMLGDKSALHRAEQIFALVVSGWDTDSTHADPGGVFWTQATWSHDRNTVSNMPGAELGLRLYQLTGKRSYLDWSKKMYDWTNKYLLAPNGLYWDHVDLSGNVQQTQWSYNQGVPIGVNVLLYEITHNKMYLQRAESIASAAYTYYIDQGNLASQGPTFNAIFFKNLLLLESITGGHKYRDAMQSYADSVWTNQRDASTGLFHFSTNGETQAIEQASMAQIYATLTWPRGQDRLLY